MSKEKLLYIIAGEKDLNKLMNKIDLPAYYGTIMDFVITGRLTKKRIKNIKKSLDEEYEVFAMIVPNDKRASWALDAKGHQKLSTGKEFVFWHDVLKSLDFKGKILSSYQQY